MEKARILIVEDEAIIAMEIESQLQSLGYEVTSIVDTGEKVIEKAESDKPDLILMDIRIKGEMDGIEAAEEIRNRFGIPVIFSTAYLDEERIERAKITMPFGYVLKPIQERDLKVTIEMALYVSKVDIERRKAEEALKESEARLIYSQEIVHLGSWVWDLSTNKREWSSEFFRILGYVPQAVEPSIETFIKHIHPDDKEYVEKIVEQIEEGKQLSVPMEHRIIRLDGTERYIAGNIKSQLGIDGKPTKMTGSMFDITERKQAEEALRQSEEKYKGVVETLPALICTFSPKNGEILFVNNAYCEYFNKLRANLIGTTFLDLIPEQDRENTWNSILELNKDNPLITHEHPVTTSKGTRWQKWTNQALFSDTGEVIGYQSFGEDITKRKWAEDALQKKTHELDERVKELNCLYGISELVAKPGISLDEIYQGIVNLIPPSWQYPNITCARIIIDSQEFLSVNFEETIWKQTANVNVHNKQHGILEVFYLEEKPEIDEGPFLKEERNLIKAIANKLGRIIERMSARNE